MPDIDITTQAQLIRRIQADFRKEAHQHREYGNGPAASDCEDRARGLTAVLCTLKGVALMAEAVGLLMPNQAPAGDGKDGAK